MSYVFRDIMLRLSVFMVREKLHLERNFLLNRLLMVVCGLRRGIREGKSVEISRVQSASWGRRLFRKGGEPD